MADQRRERRDAIAAGERRARSIEAEIADIKDTLRTLRSVDPTGAEARAAETRLADLEEQRKRAVREAREARLQAEKEEASTPPIQLGDLDRDLPLLLLPVRLETRFFKKSDETWELRVRVYPDAIHVNAHEEELTGSEVRWGRHFWEQVWKWENDEFPHEHRLAPARQALRRPPGGVDRQVADADRVRSRAPHGSAEGARRRPAPAPVPACGPQGDDLEPPGQGQDAARLLDRVGHGRGPTDDRRQRGSDQAGSRRRARPVDPGRHGPGPRAGGRGHALDGGFRQGPRGGDGHPGRHGQARPAGYARGLRVAQRHPRRAIRRALSTRSGPPVQQGARLRAPGNPHQQHGCGALGMGRRRRG